MKTIKAVVGVLRNKNQEILIAQRKQSQFMGGFWELPGGKQEMEESPEQALIRELKEELDIQVEHLSIQQTMTHHYQDRIVELDTYNIDHYQKTPQGAEGQKIAWVKITDLNNYKLLPTVKPIINSITLPDKYWITPSSDHSSKAWMDKLEQKLIQGIKLIQLRSKITLDSTIIDKVRDKCQQYNVTLLLNTPAKDFNQTHGDGWHITTNEMLILSTRPCANDKLLGASTHNLAEALKAQAMGADFIVISPVQATQTHPNTVPLGWDNAIDVVNKLNIPVYFLGGMGIQDLDKARKLGAQGIAGVSAF